VLVFVLRISVINKETSVVGGETRKGRDYNIKTDLKLGCCLEREFWLVCIKPVPKHMIFATSSPDLLTLRLLMSYIYGAPILDVSRSHTATQHSR